MIFEPRVRLKELSELCRRLATAMQAGIDARRIWAREAQATRSAALRGRLSIISDAVARGGSVSAAVDATGNFFPRLFREVVHVGEETGKLAEVFRELAEHYDHQLRLRRNFLAGIAWPMLQLAVALGVIGLLIWIMGWLGPGEGGEPIDLLGFGLTGTSGLVIYLMFLAGLAAAGFALYEAMRRGLVWTRPLQRVVMLVPGLGRSLETLALSRLAWSLHITLEAGMELRQALALSLGSTRNAVYTDHTAEVLAYVGRGGEIYEALARTGAFPRDFLDALEVGEQSGRLPESMAILSEQYQDQARRSLAVLTMLGGFAVWCLVAVLIIAMIFRLVFFYLNVLSEYSTI